MTVWTPHEYQRVAVEWLVSHKSAVLFLDMGLGKTTTTLSSLAALRSAGVAQKALIVAPKRVCQEVWTTKPGGEIGKWDQFCDTRVALLHGKDKGKAVNADADLYVINPDGLAWLIESGGMQSLLDRGVSALVVDELSQFKHTSTRRYKLLKPWLKRFAWRWGLTGSPAANGLEDLFGQIYTIDLGASLGQYVTHFRVKYFDQVPQQFGARRFSKSVPRPDTEARIYEAIKGVALSMRAIDHLDMPEYVEVDVHVTLPPAARRIYDELEKEFIASIGDGVVTASNAAVVGGKCRQVASGSLYMDAEVGCDRSTAVIHTEKSDALAEIVEAAQGQPVLVAYEFDHDLEAIRRSVGDVPAINGHTTDRRLGEIVAAWNRGEIPVLCGHPAAMGHGLNLQGAGSHVCWYSLTWNLDLYMQTVARIWRQGQKAKRVIVSRILASNTLDVRVARVIRSKRTTQDSLMQALRGG